jgi:hypothetical protein
VILVPTREELVIDHVWWDHDDLTVFKTAAIIELREFMHYHGLNNIKYALQRLYQPDTSDQPSDQTFSR